MRIDLPPWLIPEADLQEALAYERSREANFPDGPEREETLANVSMLEAERHRRHVLSVVAAGFAWAEATGASDAALAQCFERALS